VFVLPRVLEQSTIIVAGPGGVLQDDSPDYFASRVADYVLGGAGLSSRLVGRLRTQEGLAYFAYSLWTASPRFQGLAGAVTASGVGRTVEAARLLVEGLEGIRDEPPTPSEVERARAEIQGGYVFAFESASQVVARRMAYRAAGFPEDWLERYLEGIGEVTSASVASVTREHLDVAPMTILIVGDPDRFDPGLGELGPVFILDPDGSYEPWAQSPYGPGGPR
jgi:predicted Zn-dependent peptidase